MMFTASPKHTPRFRVAPFFSFALAAFALAFFSGCSGSKQEGAGASSEKTSATHDNTEEVKAYYAAHPDFFVFKTIDDLPADLVWENGGDFPEIGSPERKRGGVWQDRIQDFPRTLRIVGHDSNSSFRGYLLDDNMVGFGMIHPNMPGSHHYIPGVASEWASDLPNKTIYVRIDPRARWSDGPPVTSDDTFFLFWLYQSAYIQAPWYNNWYGIGETYTRITRYDEHTFSITLKDVRPDYLNLVLGLAPAPAHFYREVGEDFMTRYNWRFVPTTGPYVLTDAELKRTTTNRSSITFNRLADWWANDKPGFRYRFNPDQIRLRVIRETTTAWEAFLAGELDAFGMNLAEYNYERLPDDHALVKRGLVHKNTFYNDVPRPTWGLWMNTARPLLANRDVRVGIQFATNWDLVIAQYFRGDYQRLNTTAAGYGDMTHPTLHARPFDISKAGEHFAKAGFSRRGPDGILLNDAGQRLSVTITTGYEALAPVLTILQQEARKAGLEFQIELLDGSAAFKKVQEKNHDIAFTAFNVGVELYPRYWETYHSVNAYDQPYAEDGKTPNPARKAKVQTNNLQSFAVPEVDALIDRYDHSESLDEMRELAHRMEEIIHNDASFSPGFKLPFFRVASWRWVGFPEDFSVRFARDPLEANVHWIEEPLKAETLAARRDTSKSFPSVVRVHEQWKSKE